MNFETTTSSSRNALPRGSSSVAALVVLIVLCMGAQPNSSDVESRSAGNTGARCPNDMQSIGEAFCIDKYEASTAELGPDGRLVPHSPFVPVTGLRVKALSKKGVVPQAYISRNEAEAACLQAHKRLCSEREWVTACKGPTR